MKTRESRLLDCALVTLFALLAACKGRSAPETTTVQGSKDRVEAVSPTNRSYRTRDGRSAITVISANELEYRVPDGATLLCKYTDEKEALRIIVTALGTQQVLYFRHTPEGLVSNNGEVYLNPTALAALQRQEQAEREREAVAQAAQERERLAQEQRTAMRLQQSHLARAVLFETKEPAVLNLFPSRIFFVTKTTVSDVGVTVAGTERIPDARNTDKHETEPFELSFWFGETEEPKTATVYRYGKQESGPVFQMEITQIPGQENMHSTMWLYFEDSSQLEKFREAVAKARTAWRSNYGDLAQGRWR